MTQCSCCKPPGPLWKRALYRVWNMFGVLTLGVLSLAGAVTLGVAFGHGFVEALTTPAKDVRQERRAPRIPQLIASTPTQKRTQGYEYKQV